MGKNKVKKNKFTITISVEVSTVSVQYSGPFPEHLRGCGRIFHDNVTGINIESEYFPEIATHNSQSRLYLPGRDDEMDGNVAIRTFLNPLEAEYQYSRIVSAITNWLRDAPGFKVVTK